MSSNSLIYQPAFSEITARFNAFWNDEAPRRPLVWAEVPKDPSRPIARIDHPLTLRYYRATRGEWKEHMACIDQWLENTLFMGEAIPFYAPDFGPDQFAAFFGAPLLYSDANPETNWVEPILEKLEGYEPTLENSNSVWNQIRSYASALAKHAEGRYLLGACDLHSNLDALSALRHPTDLCMDLMDCPEEVARTSAAMRKFYQPIYEALYQASGFTPQTGTIGWGPFWTPGRFAVVQCDFSCMISSEDFRRHVLPGIEEEAAYLDRSMYHLDGPGALRHIEDVLSVKDLDVLQWVSGAGQKPMWQWTEVLKKGLAAGKALHIYDITPEQVKQVHSELRSRRCLYQVYAKDAQEVEELLRWLEQN
ncbi:MAG: hypothetical protein WCP06_09705 [Verrucomicrobiota bacterium]